MTIQTLHLRSNVQGKEPVAGTSAGQLPVGSIAVNFNKDEPFLTIQDSAGAIRRIAGIKVGAAAPATPTAGEAWLDTTVATKPVFKVHDGTAWQGAGSGVSTGGTAPASPLEGDLWVDTSVSAKPSLKVYNGTAFVVVTPDASETVKGVVELATTTEATTGSDTTRAVTPAGLKAALAAQAGSSTAPSAPVAGTVWVDSSTTPSVIKVYDGTNWIAQAGATVSGATPPATPATGTLWIDTSASPSVTKIYDGTNWVTATPDGSAAAAIANDAKYAAKEEVPWKRAGTTVSPKTAGDVVEISAGTAALPGLTPVGDPNTGVWAPAADTVAVSTDGSEKARIDNTGRLLVGTPSARQPNGGLQVESTGGNSFVSITRNNAASGGPELSLQKSRGTAVGQFAAVASGDVAGTINFKGADGTADITAASITAAIDGTPGANDMPGRLVFSTTADGASSPKERMRIRANGNVHVNYTGSNLPGNGNTEVGIVIERLTTGSAIFISRDDSIVARCNRNTDGELIDFRQSGNSVGSISITTSATAYNTSSDYRLKENVVPLTGAADRLNRLQVHRFNFIADPSKTVDGFLAHEAQAVVPECVTGEKDAVDADGNPEYQGIDQSKLVPLLTAALQEALKRIEALEAK